MFCKNCGKEVHPQAIACPGCGGATPLTLGIMTSNRIMKMMITLILASMVVIVIGCTAAPYDQKIEGQILSNEKGVANIKIRFLYEGKDETCDTKGIEAITNSNGNFEMTKTYTPSAIENYAVVIHPYRLCIFSNEHWQLAWKLRTGPAPHSVAFRCYMDSANKKIDKCLMSWDKQEFK